MFNLDKFISDSVTFRPINIFELLYNAYCLMSLVIKYKYD